MFTKYLCRSQFWKLRDCSIPTTFFFFLHHFHKHTKVSNLLSEESEGLKNGENSYCIQLCFNIILSFFITQNKKLTNFYFQEFKAIATSIQQKFQRSEFPPPVLKYFLGNQDIQNRFFKFTFYLKNTFSLSQLSRCNV